MRDMFEKVSKAYEGAKESVKNKWENFKKKFEGTKSEMSQEVMKAETPEELIALGKKLQQQGEALKAEKGGIEQEEGEKEKLEAEKNKIYESDRDEALEEDAARDKEKAHGEAIEENKAFDEARVAKAAGEEAKRKAELAEQDRLHAEADAKKAAEILEKIQGTGGKKNVDQKDHEKQKEEWQAGSDSEGDKGLTEGPIETSVEGNGGDSKEQLLENIDKMREWFQLESDIKSLENVLHDRNSTYERTIKNKELNDLARELEYNRSHAIQFDMMAKNAKGGMIRKDGGEKGKYMRSADIYRKKSDEIEQIIRKKYEEGFQNLSNQASELGVKDAETLSLDGLKKELDNLYKNI